MVENLKLSRLFIDKTTHNMWDLFETLVTAVETKEPNWAHEPLCTLLFYAICQKTDVLTQAEYDLCLKVLKESSYSWRIEELFMECDSYAYFFHNENNIQTITNDHIIGRLFFDYFTQKHDHALMVNMTFKHVKLAMQTVAWNHVSTHPVAGLMWEKFLATYPSSKQLELIEALEKNWVGTFNELIQTTATLLLSDE